MKKFVFILFASLLMFLVGPPSVSAGTTAFGVNIFINFLSAKEGKSSEDLPAFKKDIDLLAQSSRIRTIRIPPFAWDIMDLNSGHLGFIGWNQEGLAVWDEAINYAFDKGFRIVLTTSPHDTPCRWLPQGTPNCWAADPNFNLDNYLEYARMYFSFLANRWEGKIWVWSPWNEIDQFCFTRFASQECFENNGLIQTDPPNYMNSEDYLDKLNRAFATARQAIQEADPNALIAGHVGIYPMKFWFQRSLGLFDKINSNIDIIATSLYPEGKQDYFNLIPTIIAKFREKYQKPVFVLETGVLEFSATGHPQCQYGSKEPEPRSSLFKKALGKINGNADIGLIYRMRDEKDDWAWECPYWGIVKADGAAKSSYQAIKDYADQFGAIAEADCSSGDNTPCFADYYEACGTNRIQFCHKKGVCFEPKKCSWGQGSYCEPCKEITPMPTNTSIPTKPPTPIPFCYKCTGGLSHSLGNANCDSKVDLIDFAMWQAIYSKILKGQAVTEAEKAKVDFNCQETDKTHQADLIDFAIWKKSYQDKL